MPDFDELTEVLDPVLLQARNRIGRVLDGKWRLDVLLGVGGMAAVYAATHRNGNRAAIKLLHPELAASHEVRSRFLREGYIANAVEHDGTVRVLDDDADDDGTPFLVVELLDGETLEERRMRAGGTLSEDEVLCIADQILDVLSAAHDKGIVHRDLKPENIFVTRDGQVKVLDFGIAKLRAASTASTATQAGASMGTPAYMPPEQARGLWDQVDARSDLWAVGAVMFTALSGETPHSGRTAQESLLSAMTTEPARLAAVAPHVSPSVARLVDRAMAFDRERRWTDSRRMQDVLRRAYFDRHAVAITTAPRLRVPADVPNRTLSSSAGAIAASLPTTGQPVAGPGPGPSARAYLPTPALVAGAAAVATGTVLALVWFLVSAISRPAPGATDVGRASATESRAVSTPLPSASVVPTTTPAPSTAVSAEPLTALPEASVPSLPPKHASAPTPIAPQPRPTSKRDPLAP